MKEILSQEEINQKARDKWTDQWSEHMKKLTDMPKPLDRWSYICNEVESKMCDRLYKHCVKIGMVIEKPVLDWTALHQALDKIGTERCASEGCDNKALRGFGHCILCRRKIEKEIENKRRAEREANYA